MQASYPDICPDLDQVLRYLGLGERKGRAFFHRAQDLQSFLMHRAAVRLLRADPTLTARVENTLFRWRERADPHTLPLLERWEEIVEKRDWDAALANTDSAQQLRQGSPLAGLLPEGTRLAIIRYVTDLKNENRA